MANNSIERTSRALDLIPYITAHPGVSIEELAKHFGTTNVEISETLSILFMCGLPGYSHLELIDLTTEDGVVAVMDPQNLDKPRKLSQTEILSLILGLENLRQQAPEDFAAKEILPLISKLKNVLGESRILQQIEVASSTSTWSSEIHTAIVQKRAMQFGYRSLGKEEFTDRKVQPIRLYSRSGEFYFEGVTETNELRNFRLDRIENLQVLSDSLPGTSSVIANLEYEVVVSVPKASILFVEQVSGLLVKREEFGDSLQLTLQVSHFDWIRRALSSITGKVEIISPEEVRESFHDFTEQALNNYR